MCSGSALRAHGRRTRREFRPGLLVVEVITVVFGTSVGGTFVAGTFVGGTTVGATVIGGTVVRIGTVMNCGVPVPPRAAVIGSMLDSTTSSPPVLPGSVGRKRISMKQLCPSVSVAQSSSTVNGPSTTTTMSSTVPPLADSVTTSLSLSVPTCVSANSTMSRSSVSVAVDAGLPTSIVGSGGTVAPTPGDAASATVASTAMPTSPVASVSREARVKSRLAESSSHLLSSTSGCSVSRLGANRSPDFRPAAASRSATFAPPQRQGRSAQ